MASILLRTLTLQLVISRCKIRFSAFWYFNWLVNFILDDCIDVVVGRERYISVVRHVSQVCSTRRPAVRVNYL